MLQTICVQERNGPDLARRDAESVTLHHPIIINQLQLLSRQKLGNELCQIRYILQDPNVKHPYKSSSYLLIFISPANKEISERIIRGIEGVIIEEIAALREAAFACRDAVCNSLSSPFALVVGSMQVSKQLGAGMSD